MFAHAIRSIRTAVASSRFISAPCAINISYCHGKLTIHNSKGTSERKISFIAAIAPIFSDTSVKYSLAHNHSKIQIAHVRCEDATIIKAFM